MRPTVLVLASTYPRWPGDPEPGFVHELCRRLLADFDVIALVPDAPGANPSGKLDGVEVIRYRYAPRRLQTLVNNGGIATNLKLSPWKWLLVPLFILGQYLAARRLLRQRRVDLVHAHWLIPQGVIARQLCRKASIPFLVTSHGGDLFGFQGRMLNALKRQVASACAAMTVVSSAMKEEVARLQLHPPSVHVLPMGVDMHERFVPDPAIERDSDSLLFVGRLVPKKGLRHLLDALPAVLARRPATILTIAGFGPEEAALRTQAHRLGIADNVRFLGATSQSDLPGLYQRASLFVAPFIRDISGNQEGLPVVLMEAIGCGCPALVGEVAGIHDLLGDQAVGICFQPGDSNLLAAAILAVLEDPRLAQSGALALRRVAVNNVDWQIVAARYAGLLDACRVHHPAIPAAGSP